jgi:hypothetical protein
MISIYFGFDTPTTPTFTQWPSFVTVTYSRPTIPIVQETIDERYNPRYWARWFREFLEALRPVPLKRLSIKASRTFRPFFLSNVRSGPPKIREWKMKNWIQTLEVTV